jgi:magnesium transporter
LRRLLRKKNHRKSRVSAAGRPEQKESAPVSARITVIDYDETSFSEISAKTADEVFPYCDSPSVTWINVDSIQDHATIDRLGGHLNIHPLILEDIANPHERAKIEDCDDYIYLVVKMLNYPEYTEKMNAEGLSIDEMSVEQLSILVGPHYVITFQEGDKPGDPFNPIRERLRTGKGRIRKMGADYLCYTLVDCIIDRYFVALENLAARIEILEDELISNPRPATLQAIHDLKREMLYLHKSVWPLREVISRLQRSDSEFFSAVTRTYFKDVYDHTIQVIETIETYREMISGMLDIYLSSISFKTNEIMKVLTIISTIFIPLTFFAGVYGMNFEYFPELKWKFGYPMFWIIDFMVASAMLLYFKKRKWL